MNGVEGGSIAYLGPPASYTHLAALECFPEDSYKIDPQHSIEDVFEAVQSGVAVKGLVPFENSTNGSVIFTLDLFADTAGRYPDVQVCAEVFIEVHHCLVGHKPHPLPTTSQSPGSSGCPTPTTQVPSPTCPKTQPKIPLGHLKKIYSHPQVWGQCNAFLSWYLRGIERQDVSSTSKAAELVASDPSHHVAAISSLIAARVHNLDVLAESIEDRSNNSTRFFVIRKGPGLLMPKANGASLEAGDHGQYKTLISFTIDHDNPGALAQALSVFQRYQLNLTSINTRPSGTVPWNYIFLVEIEGRKLDEGGHVNAALQDVANATQQFRWLGSWENKLAS